jgi:uncharacterized protein YbgA (DUF1722 family)/uncharacterized protein YbbK (DUF523 family)
MAVRRLANVNTEKHFARSEKIRVGISSCLLGAQVRFDGGHKQDRYVNGTLAQYFDFAPVCPEMAIGLGVPREPIRLVQQDNGIHVVGTRNPDLNVTEALESYGRKMAASLATISGYIFKRASPSCGMERVKVYTPEGTPVGTGAGAYAKAFMEAQPLLPVEEEGRLGDPVLRENFILRVWVYHRWQRLMAEGISPAKLVAFHTDHKYLIMAHCQSAYRRMGRLVAEAGTRSMRQLSEEYVTELMAALKNRVKRKQHVNVLHHLMGYLRPHLDAGDRDEIMDTVEQYRAGLVPLIVPITLIRHCFRRHPDPYVERQHYMTPYPPELSLRNGV